MFVNPHRILSGRLRKNAGELQIYGCEISEVGKRPQKFYELLKKSFRICVLFYGTDGEWMPLISGKKMQMPLAVVLQQLSLVWLMWTICLHLRSIYGSCGRSGNSLASVLGVLTSRWGNRKCMQGVFCIFWTVIGLTSVCRCPLPISSVGKGERYFSWLDFACSDSLCVY